MSGILMKIQSSPIYLLTNKVRRKYFTGKEFFLSGELIY